MEDLHAYSAACGDDVIMQLPLLSSSGSGSTLPDPADGLNKADSHDLERRLQRKMAQKEAQQRYRCVVGSTGLYSCVRGSRPFADMFISESRRRQRKKFKFTELQAELQKLTKEDRETRRQRSALSSARNELEVLTLPLSQFPARCSHPADFLTGLYERPFC